MSLTFLMLTTASDKVYATEKNRILKGKLGIWSMICDLNPN